LPAANSLNMTVMQFGAIIGPLLAGLLLNWVDLSTLYLIDTITTIAPIWATFRLAPMPTLEQGDGSDRRGQWGIAAVLDGFRYLAGNTVVLMSFVVDLVAMILGMPRALFPQGPPEFRRAGCRWRHDGAAGGGDVGGCGRRRGCSPGGYRGCGGRAWRSSWRSRCGAWRWSASVW
jgi:hypothetical protein